MNWAWKQGGRQWNWFKKNQVTCSFNLQCFSLRLRTSYIVDSQANRNVPSPPANCLPTPSPTPHATQHTNTCVLLLHSFWIKHPRQSIADLARYPDWQSLGNSRNFNYVVEVATKQNWMAALNPHSIDPKGWCHFAWPQQNAEPWKESLSRMNKTEWREWFNKFDPIRPLICLFPLLLPWLLLGPVHILWFSE